MDFFLVIGAQKAGTSWLHQQLDRHPEVHVPAWKEMHYFDMARPPYPSANFMKWYLRSARNALSERRVRAADRMLEIAQLPFLDNDGTAYRNYLLRKAEEGVRVVGELTPAYSALTEEGFRFAHDVLGGPKIIFVMRDPLDRLWSAIRMNVADDPDAHFTRPITSKAHWGRSDYPGTIRRLESVFSTDLIHYAFYEDLFTPEALGEMATFLGVSPVWPWRLDERVRAGREAPIPEPAPALLEQLLPVYEFVRERFGDRVPSSWRH